MILIDTGPLVALCDPRDSFHKTARRDLKKLAGSQLAVCDPVLTETCFHLQEIPLRLLLRDLLDRLNVIAVPMDDSQSLWNEVFRWLEKYHDHDPDWIDGYLAVLSGRDRTHKIWTYDDEFRTVWRRLNGASIPMAVRHVR